MGGSRRFVGSFAWLLGDRVLKLLITVFINGVVARYLGPQAHGVLQYALAAVAVTSILVTQGFDQLVVMRLVQRKDRQGEILGAVLLLRVVGFLLYGVVTGALILRSRSEADPLMAVLLFAYGANVFDFCDLWFQSRSLNRRTVLSRQLSLVLSATLRVGLVLTRAPLLAFAVAQVVEAALFACAQVISFHSSGGPWPRSYATAKESRRLIAEGWPLMGVALCVLAYSKADSVILGHLGYFSDLGFYAAALKVIDYANVFPMILSVSLLPYLASGSVSPAILRSLGLAYMASWVGAASVCVFAPFIVKILYGGHFLQAAESLRIACWVLPVVFFSVLRHGWLLAKGHVRTALAFEMGMLVLSVSLNLWLCPRFGARGAAMAFVAAAYGANAIGIALLPPLREAFLLYLSSFRVLRRREVG